MGKLFLKDFSDLFVQGCRQFFMALCGQMHMVNVIRRCLHHFICIQIITSKLICDPFIFCGPVPEISLRILFPWFLTHLSFRILCRYSVESRSGSAACRFSSSLWLR